MFLEEVRTYCLNKKGVQETFPFDESTLVFKVLGKVFALCNVDDFTGINLKCDPDKAVDLRETHEGIRPGYHMNKKHWITVDVTSDVSTSLLLSLIDHSYDLVVRGLPQKTRQELANR